MLSPRDTLRSSRDGSNDPHGLARREGLGPGCHLRSRGCRRPDLHRGRLRRGQRREAPRHRLRTLRQIRRQRPLSDRPTLRRTAGEQPGAPRSGPARRGGFMRRARPVDPSRLDHGRYPARRHPRPLHGSGCGKGRRRRRNADAAPERHGTHPARALGVDLPPRLVAASGGRGPRRRGRGLERRAFRTDAADDAATRRRRAESHHGNAQQGPLEQPVLRRLRRYDRLDAPGRRHVGV